MAGAQQGLLLRGRRVLSPDSCSGGLSTRDAPVRSPAHVAGVSPLREEALAYFRRILRMGYFPPRFMCSLLVQLLVNEDMPNEAEEVFQDIVDRGVSPTEACATEMIRLRVQVTPPTGTGVKFGWVGGRGGGRCSCRAVRDDGLCTHAASLAWRPVAADLPFEMLPSRAWSLCMDPNRLICEASQHNGLAGIRPSPKEPWFCPPAAFERGDF